MLTISCGLLAISIKNSVKQARNLDEIWRVSFAEFSLMKRLESRSLVGLSKLQCDCTWIVRVFGLRKRNCWVGILVVLRTAIFQSWWALIKLEAVIVFHRKSSMIAFISRLKFCASTRIKGACA